MTSMSFEIIRRAIRSEVLKSNHITNIFISRKKKFLLASNRNTLQDVYCTLLKSHYNVKKAMQQLKSHTIKT